MSKWTRSNGLEARLLWEVKDNRFCFDKGHTWQCESGDASGLKAGKWWVAFAKWLMKDALSVDAKYVLQPWQKQLKMLKKYV